MGSTLLRPVDPRVYNCQSFARELQTMRSWVWVVPAALGLALILHSYDRLLKGDPEAPWASGFLCIGPGGTARPLDVGTRISTRSALFTRECDGPGDAQGHGHGETGNQSRPGSQASSQTHRAAG